MDFNQTRNLSSLKVLNMIGNQILSSLNPLNPILEGRAFLALFDQAPFLFNRYKPKSDFWLPEGIVHHFQTNIGIFQSP